MSEAVLPPGWPAMSIAQAHALITGPGQVTEVEEIDIRGVKTKVWKNLPGSLRDVVAYSRQHGERMIEFALVPRQRAVYLVYDGLGIARVEFVVDDLPCGLIFRFLANGVLFVILHQFGDEFLKSALCPCRHSI